MHHAPRCSHPNPNAHAKMPPKAASANAAKRKGPQFNPPRPVKAPTQTAAAKRAQAKKAAPNASRPDIQPAAEIISSDDDEQFEEDAPSFDDDLMQDVEDAPSPVLARPAPPIITTPNPIPAPLLARLLYENFEDPNTQIQKGAMNLVGKYMEIFVREAFARAKNEREMGVKAGGIGDGFLQVEDLEKLAPQLVLDF
jgi:hypothetical protein